MLGAVLVVAPGGTAQTASEMPSEHWSAGVDAGWADPYDDSGWWAQGYAVGVSGFYSLATTALVGGRFGVAHWDFIPDGVIDELIPPGGIFELSKTTGQTEILEFGGFARLERPALLPFKFGVFVQLSAQADYVKNFARVEVVYSTNVTSNILTIYDLNESNWRLGLTAGAGIGRPLTDQSMIEVFPWYRAVVQGGDDIGVWGISFGWRLRV